MSLKSYLRFQIKVLKFLGFQWDATKLSCCHVLTSLSITITLFSAVILFAPRDKKDISNGNNLFVLLGYRVMATISMGTIVLNNIFSMFCLRTKRSKLYEALAIYEDLISFHEKKFKKQKRKQIITLLIRTIYHVFLLVLSPMVFQYSFGRIMGNIVFTFCNYLMFQNLCFTNTVLFVIRKLFQLTNELIEEKHLPTKEIIFLKLKLREVMELFNESFGPLMLYNSLITFINFTFNYYLIISKTTSFDNSAWMIILQMDNLPLYIARTLMFYESNQIKQKER